MLVVRLEAVVKHPAAFISSDARSRLTRKALTPIIRQYNWHRCFSLMPLSGYYRQEIFVTGVIGVCAQGVRRDPQASFDGLIVFKLRHVPYVVLL